VTDAYVLAPEQWPAMPLIHREFLARALPKLQADQRLEGVAAGGSFISGALDEQSDLDLVVVAVRERASEVVHEAADLARGLGPLLAAFPGDHVGELRLLICLFGPPLLHVDFKFLSTDELSHRVEEPVVLWDRRGRVRAALSTSKGVYPSPRFQWMEDRFWVWMHYTATKIARGELFEAIDALTFVRARVLGPLVLAGAGAQPNGVRRIEQYALDRVAGLRDTVPSHDRESCRDALLATVQAYTELREQLAPATLVRRSEAERAVRDFLRRPEVSTQS
jgi:predicted nucleotidyltransferase